MNQYLIRHKLFIAGIALGAIGGYLYYHFIGCSTGSCAITSRPVNSTVYGAIMGALFFNIFKPSTRKVADDDEFKSKDINR